MSILKFGIAVNERRKNKQTGDWEDFPQYVDLSLFGRRAEALAQYLTKGTKVAIEGRLHYSSWEDRNGGGKRSKLDVTVDEVEFMSRRDESRSGGSNGGGAARGRGRAQEPSDAYMSDSDIPF